jgi:hypothetical protein
LPVVDKVVVPDVLIVLGLAVTVIICGRNLTRISEVFVRLPNVTVIVHVPAEVPVII